MVSYQRIPILFEEEKRHDHIGQLLLLVKEDTCLLQLMLVGKDFIYWSTLMFWHLLKQHIFCPSLDGNLQSPPSFEVCVLSYFLQLSIACRGILSRGPFRLRVLCNLVQRIFRWHLPRRSSRNLRLAADLYDHAYHLGRDRKQHGLMGPPEILFRYDFHGVLWVAIY